MNKKQILLVEDEHNIVNFLTIILNTGGYDVYNAKTGKKAIAMAADNNFDMILLDLGLPDFDGMKVLKSIREWSDVPIIVVSARDGEHQKVEAFDAGANDYITKPFGNSELLARIRSAIRLHKRAGSVGYHGGEVFSMGNLKIDYARRLVMEGDRLVHLTPIEYKIVVLLSQNAGRVISNDTITNHVWGSFASCESDRQVLRVNIANIRRKLEKNPADPKYILTEIGVGYKMVEHEDCKGVRECLPQ